MIAAALGKKKTEEVGATMKFKSTGKKMLLKMGRKGKFSLCHVDGNANVKDIITEDFSVSAPGKELLKNASVKISHEDTVGDDDRTALEAVVSTNEELSKLPKEVETLQNSASAFSCEEEGDHDDDDNAGNKLELYEKWQFMGSYAAEAQGSKFLLGWASQRIYKGCSLVGVLVPLEEKNHGLSHVMDSLNSVFTKIIHLHDLKLHFYCDLDEKQIKAAKRRGNWVQPKFVAAKEKNKVNGKVDDDESLSCGP
ncbi:PREDICTED: ABC transporter [Prunus dulcis]|uniref:PREDICTED: ABC transporter n=1 Tax=Prunus dulcis TaxID=3755 RepID=A0A5E4G3U6_PRUDU|nr:PREDICTED: ABC transporter [Prunus dulcis]